MIQINLFSEMPKSPSSLIKNKTSFEATQIKESSCFSITLKPSRKSTMNEKARRCSSKNKGRTDSPQITSLTKNTSEGEASLGKFEKARQLNLRQIAKLESNLSILLEDLTSDSPFKMN